MSAIRYYDHAVIEIDGESPIRVGSLTTPVSVTIDGEIEDRTWAVATATTRLVWAALGGGITGFKFLRIESDQIIYLEIVVDVGNQAGTERIAIQLLAGRPFVLFSGVAAANYTADFGVLPLTVDAIEEIRIRNDSGEIAEVRLIVAK